MPHDHHPPAVARSANRPIDPVAVRLLAAAAEGCQPCQLTEIPSVLTRPVAIADLARLAFRPFQERARSSSDAFTTADLTTLTGRLAPSTRRLLHAGLTHPESTTALTTKLGEADRAKVVRDALDTLIGAGALPPVHLPPSPGDLAPSPAPTYTIRAGLLEAFGRQLPILCLEPESAGAGLEDLRGRCALAPIQWPNLPPIDADWRLFADEDRRAFTEITHVDGNGVRDLTLWAAPYLEPVPLDLWRLLAMIEYALVVGPGDGPPGSWITAASRAGKLAGTLARFSPA